MRGRFIVFARQPPQDRFNLSPPVVQSPVEFNHADVNCLLSLFHFSGNNMHRRDPVGISTCVCVCVGHEYSKSFSSRKIGIKSSFTFTRGTRDNYSYKAALKCSPLRYNYSFFLLGVRGVYTKRCIMKCKLSLDGLK